MAALTLTPTPTSIPGTVSLPVQTTPFVYQPPEAAASDAATSNPCVLSVVCLRNWWEYSASAYPLAGALCWAGQQMGSPGAPAYQVYNDPACYPSGYFSHLGWDGAEPGNDLMSPSPAGAASLVAYPGTACISDWTTACTTTFTADAGALVSQAWCCASGYTCATATDGADPRAPERLCMSLLSTATNVFMSFDPAHTFDGSDYYTWTTDVAAVPSQYAASVFHPVFPLSLTIQDPLVVASASATAAELLVTTPPSSLPRVVPRAGGLGQRQSTFQPTSRSEMSASTLSAGQIFGTVTGVAIFLGLLVIVGHLCFARRKRNRRAPAIAAAVAEKGGQQKTESESESESELGACERTGTVAQEPPMFVQWK